MKAYFGKDNKPRVDVTVIGLDREVQVTALIDTGFDGALMVSLPAALSIGLKLSTVIPIELADGSVKREYVFEGTVRLGDQVLPVDILLTPSEESLLGTALLRGQQLTIDFAHEIVKITPVAR